MFDDLSGRTAVITGGARGLGFSIASALARQGVSIALLDLLPQVAESAESITSDHGVASAGYVVDAVDAHAVEAAFDSAAAELGPASILVTAAGITIWGDSTDVEPDSWQKVLDVNLNGTFFAAQSFARRAADSGLDSSAIFVSSMSGFIVNQPQFQASYNASKAAVSQLAKSLAVEWATRNIRVNAIAPGYFLSDMTRAFTDENPDLAVQWRDSIPMGRMGEPADLDGLIIYLASTASSYMTGQSLIIDGGYTAV
jgi:NAD(P)-dependent dehydrogenase (short-subunit alcohol dehydrogenase family)